MNRFHMVTGGPGSGKGTLIAALGARGFDHIPESGRDIIRAQVSAGGTALPWNDRPAFAETMFARGVETYHAALAKLGIVLSTAACPM